ncbi:uncharacterized protein LOC141784470 [Halichoeres trimaculatus]|uniref:uncharacterized protein LOC141784470 n=1 Tax=Halichoeres trimaculatus TaxID=147232 RepID=UPI003D9DC78D
MTSPTLLLYLAVFILDSSVSSAQVTHPSSSAHGERSFVSAKVGDNITVRCSSEGSMVTKFFWYKQPLGQKPRLLSTFVAANKKFSFHDEWKNNPRFTLDTKNDGNNLIISDLHISDTATYLCAGSFSITFDFFRGVLLSVQSSALDDTVVVHQSGPESIQPGGSVTLNCTVQTGTCDGEESVYWFRTSEGTGPGLIYTSREKNDQCQREHSRPTCVYNLLLQKVNRSHVGTYYCAVASCGRVTFGNRTHLGLEDGGDSLVLVYVLSAFLAFTTILTVSLAYILMVRWKQTSRQRRGVALSYEISQPVDHLTVKLGDPATVECHIKSEEPRRVWYKMTTGMKLQLVATFNSEHNDYQFVDKFSQRYSITFNNIGSHLSINTTTWEDTGTYFCGVKFINEIQFGSGTFLVLKGASLISDSVVQHPESLSAQPGESGTLSCSVHTSCCAAEHTSVVWLKNSPRSAPQMIYSSRCENQTHEGTEGSNSTCVYNLIMRNLSSDDDGTYHCVLTACGQILFGNGTRINIHNNTETTPVQPSPAVIALVLSNIILGVVTLVLSWKLCKRRSKDKAGV